MGVIITAAAIVLLAVGVLSLVDGIKYCKEKRNNSKIQDNASSSWAAWADSHSPCHSSSHSSHSSSGSYDCKFHIKASLFDPMIKIEILDSIGTHLKTFNINVKKLTIKLENTK